MKSVATPIASKQIRDLTPAVVLESLRPLDERAAIIDLLQEVGVTNCADLFDWHYGAGACPSYSWCLRDCSTRSVVGFIAVFERRFRWRDLTLRAGVPGDLALAPNARSLGNAVRLIRATQLLVRSGDLDFLVVQGNDRSDPLIERLGYVSLGNWQNYHLLRNAKALRPRASYAKVAATRLGSIWATHRLAGMRLRAQYRIERLARDQIAEVAAGDWPGGDQIAVEFAGHSLAWRYLDDPLTPTELWVARAPDARVAAFFAVSERDDGGIHVRDFGVDRRQLTSSEAVHLLIEWAADRPMLTFRALRGSSQASQLLALGCIPGRRQWSRPVKLLVAKTNPFVDALLSPGSWQLLPGYLDV